MGSFQNIFHWKPDDKLFREIWRLSSSQLYHATRFRSFFHRSRRITERSSEMSFRDNQVLSYFMIGNRYRFVFYIFCVIIRWWATLAQCVDQQTTLQKISHSISQSSFYYIINDHLLFALKCMVIRHFQLFCLLPWHSGNVDNRCAWGTPCRVWLLGRAKRCN